MDNYHFDKVFREKLDTHPSSVPDDMWNRINKNKKKKGGVFFLNRAFLLGVGMLFLISGLGASLWFFDQNAGGLVDDKSTITAYDADEQKEAKSSLISSNTPPKTFESKGILNNPTTQSSSPTLLTKSPLIAQKSTPKTKKSTTNLNNNQPFIKTIPFSVTPVSVSPMEDVLSASSGGNSGNIYYSNFDKLNPILPPSQLIVSTNNNGTSISTSFENKLRKRKRKSDGGCTNIHHQSRHNYFSLDGIFAPEWSNRTLSATSNSSENSFAEYITQRENSEVSEFAFSTGARFSYNFRNGFSLRSGIFFNQIQETFTYEADESKLITTVVTETITNPDGTTSTETTTSVESIDGVRFVKSFNKYQFIDVPLLLGYNYNFGQFGMSANVGGIYNLSFTQKGKMLSQTDATPTILSGTANDPNFKGQSGWSLYGSLSLNYPLNERFDLLIEPYARYIINPLNNELNNPIEQKYWFTGIGAGLRWNF